MTLIRSSSSLAGPGEAGTFAGSGGTGAFAGPAEVGPLAAPAEEDSFDGAATIRLEIARSLGRLRRIAQSLTASRADAEDLLQTTCLRALERSRFLRHPTNVLSWLTRIMRNLRIDEARRIADVAASPAGCPEVQAAPVEPMPLWRLADESFLDRMVPTLSPEFRSVWELTHVDKLRQSEIARRLGIKESTVASRMFRARAALRFRLLEEYRTSAEPVVAMTVGRVSA
jgi:RNA polymerase sigma-70 factor (ECF subfamily)